MCSVSCHATNIKIITIKAVLIRPLLLDPLKHAMCRETLVGGANNFIFFAEVMENLFL